MVKNCFCLGAGKIDRYRNYCVYCHVVFYVTVVTFVMTLPMNKVFTSTVTDDSSLDKIIETKFGILSILIFYVTKCCHGGLKF